MCRHPNEAIPKHARPCIDSDCPLPVARRTRALGWTLRLWCPLPLCTPIDPAAPNHTIPSVLRPRLHQVTSAAMTRQFPPPSTPSQTSAARRTSSVHPHPPCLGDTTFERTQMIRNFVTRGASSMDLARHFDSLTVLLPQSPSYISAPHRAPKPKSKPESEPRPTPTDVAEGFPLFLGSSELRPHARQSQFLASGLALARASSRLGPEDHGASAVSTNLARPRSGSSSSPHPSRGAPPSPPPLQAQDHLTLPLRSLPHPG
ncbi:hypothetical protein K438DRAFT_1963800 [Mycena galopus ATCC 62051]|nr:hypothetical protein K438DRAFT_1963800 [Mycena galopus ATCC 62051]